MIFLDKKRVHSDLHTQSAKNHSQVINFIRKTNQPFSNTRTTSRHCVSCASQNISKSESVSLIRMNEVNIEKPRYNKWFIKPRNRMKKNVSLLNVNKTNADFYYNNLYKEQYPDPGSPFKNIANQKLQLCAKITKTNFRFLQIFKKMQEQKKKRVPSLVQMIVNKNIEKMKK